MDGSSHLGAASWLSSAPLPLFLQRIPRAKLHHPLAAFSDLSSDETTKQCFAWKLDCHAPKSAIIGTFGVWKMGTLICSWKVMLSESTIVLVKQLWDYSCLTAVFGWILVSLAIQPDFLMPQLKALNMVEHLFCFHLHHGWRVRLLCFMASRGPIWSDRTTQAETENLSIVHFPATKRLHRPPLSHLGPSPTLFYWDQLIVYLPKDKKTRPVNYALVYQRCISYNLLKVKQETNKKQS